jgi:hypothetical protein
MFMHLIWYVEQLEPKAKKTQWRPRPQGLGSENCAGIAAHEKGNGMTDIYFFGGAGGDFEMVDLQR